MYWFAEKGTFYNLTPKEFKNKLLFNSILQKDVFSIMEIKKYKLNLENNNEKIKSMEIELKNNNEKIKSMEIELKNNNIDIENKINNFKEIVQFSSEIKEIKKDLLHKKVENEELKYRMISFRKLFFKYKKLYEKSIEDTQSLKENSTKHFLKFFKND